MDQSTPACKPSANSGQFSPKEIMGRTIRALCPGLCNALWGILFGYSRLGDLPPRALNPVCEVKSLSNQLIIQVLQKAVEDVKLATLGQVDSEEWGRYSLHLSKRSSREDHAVLIVRNSIMTIRQAALGHVVLNVRDLKKSVGF